MRLQLTRLPTTMAPAAKAAHPRMHRRSGRPRVWTAILWPSVLAEAPDTMDPRTPHEALPVTGGEKFGANFWIHQYDFKTPHKVGCTMD